jgi:hypothetical protein
MTQFPIPSPSAPASPIQEGRAQPTQAGRGRERAAGVHLARRVWRVRLIRILLLGGAAAVVVGFGLSILSQLNAPVDTIESAKVDRDGRLTINAPRFFGRSASGQQVEISARSAIRASGDLTAPITLDAPRMGASDGTLATAETGSWQEQTQTLVLRGMVDVILKGGGRATADEAVWRPTAPLEAAVAGLVESAQPQSGEPESDVQGPAEQADGERRPAGSELVLSGRVKLLHNNGDVVEAQQASWDSGRNLLLLYGATSFRQANGDSITAPSAQWNTASGELQMTGGVEYRRGEAVFARAGTLSWSQATGRAALAGGVVVTMQDGQARSDRAAINIPAGTIAGDGGVTLATKLGMARARAYEYNARSGQLVLRGAARITTQR